MKYFIKKLIWTVRWYILPGVTINVPWPVIESSADPNDIYRPWLEEHVGQQKWDWDWRLQSIYGSSGRGTITIEFRKGKEDDAVMASLMWK